ncbi:hypothetical protein SADUNF_Sadunf09G0043800 [Salix dunnii]|uniref:Uncharacterized protein n=1 Tax=Salix dunnii TaxID=1413687 RepID=A0A835JXK5_9ROSI|nr:hypothetical protein SADUNF_Sadunf09G0043800 [Salix dunnii]
MMVGLHIDIAVNNNNSQSGDSHMSTMQRLNLTSFGDCHQWFFQNGCFFSSALLYTNPTIEFKSSQCLLDELQISWCPFLKSIPRGILPINLKSFAISWCKNLIEIKQEDQDNLGTKPKLWTMAYRANTRKIFIKAQGIKAIPYHSYLFFMRRQVRTFFLGDLTFIRGTVSCSCQCSWYGAMTGAPLTLLKMHSLSTRHNAQGYSCMHDSPSIIPLIVEEVEAFMFLALSHVFSLFFFSFHVLALNSKPLEFMHVRKLLSFELENFPVDQLIVCAISALHAGSLLHEN